MIAFVGIKKDTDIYIRERLIVKAEKKEEYLKKMHKRFEEVVILNTCNRTEIYFNHSENNEKEILKEIFDILDWDRELIEHVFYITGKQVYKHLFEVVCGYHSKIIGEDQILGQVRDCYMDSINASVVRKELGRLFQEAITCGKKFRSEAKLYEIPVSSVSIAVNSLIEEKSKNVMVIGYGDVGKLAIKYLISHNVHNIYLVLRNLSKAEELKDTNVKIIEFNNRNKYINDMDAIISCTSAPFPVITIDDISKEGNKVNIYDMAVPRDVQDKVGLLSRTRVYNIDEISAIEDKNRVLRVEKMGLHRYIINKYIEEYDEWLKLRNISPVIRQLKEKGNEIYEKRALTFEHKCKSIEDKKLVNTLLKSTSDSYIHRAIEVLKEESLNGGDECLRIIKKIFLTEKN